MGASATPTPHSLLLLLSHGEDGDVAEGMSEWTFQRGLPPLYSGNITFYIKLSNTVNILELMVAWLCDDSNSSDLLHKF